MLFVISFVERLNSPPVRFFSFRKLLGFFDFQLGFIKIYDAFFYELGFDWRDFYAVLCHFDFSWLI